MKTVAKILMLCCVCLFILLSLDRSFPSASFADISSSSQWRYAGPRNTQHSAHHQGNRTLPNALIFGIRKCGTRALLTFLNGHPQISAVEYEVHFFDRYYARGLEWYRQQMPLATPSQRTLEKTPAYFITPDAPQRVYNMDKDVKLILIVRDPVTRAISDYTQTWYNRDGRNETTEPFETLALDPYTQSVNLYFKPLWVSIYHHHLKLWLEYFPLSQIHIVDGDNLVKDPSAELMQVESFLDLDPYLTKDKFYFNATKGFYCMRATHSDKCLGDSKGRSHPTITHRVLRKLRQFYKSHNSLFYNLIGRTFNWS